MAGAIERVAMVGYGRFGRALAGLVREQGGEVSAYDPYCAPRGAPLVEQLAEALSTAQLVVFAVPLAALEGALQQARPHLRSDQIVTDVHSVKAAPSRLLEKYCGAEIPWVATHPLFGPDSLALGERPLGVVVAPNATHARAVERVAEYYRRLGCEVRRQTPDEHDEAMAHTHALAFFIAGALVELGIDRYVESAPPSFRALAGTIASVRADAGHLMATIQRDNAFAADARQALIDALRALDQRLAQPDEAVDVPRRGESR